MPQVRAARLDWSGSGMRFQGEGTEPQSPPIVVDGDGVEGPSPMLTLLLAAAGCTGSDVVSIFEKMRVGLKTLAIEVTGTRRDDEPRRYVALTFHFTIGGESLDANKAERAVSLSLDKYCSVVHSLNPDIAIEHEIELV